MRALIVTAVALSIAGFGAENVHFDAIRQGQLPPDWSVHAQPGMKWQVRADRNAPSHPNVLEGAGESDAPIAVFDKVVCSDGDLSVKFRISDNQHSNAAGIVWRYQDPANYYLLTLGPAGNSIRLSRVHNGKSETIPPMASHDTEVVDIRPGQWHVVKVSFRGPKVQVFFGNRGVFTAQDSGIAGPGKTGLWVKGASGAAFDDFRIDKKS